MEFEKIRFDVDDRVATITFNRPDNANEDPAILAVVVTGAGSFFSAGGDLSAFADAGEGAGALLKEMTTYFHGAISRFSRMDAPIIAAVNGTAAGAGFSFAAACDIAIAADTAMFTSAYTAASLTPDGSSTYFVPRLVGMRRAMELMLTNRRLSAVEALEWGLITQVVPADQLMETATALAHKLAAGGTLAFGAVKRMLHESLSGTLETQMEMEARSIAAMSHTHDGQEGITAFFEKRRPEFLGR
jgi:2-(1,2-epoxy-1,2-dihydrophenyl)acetyl-CoA isomerase